MTCYGNQLSKELQTKVLSIFTNRYTTEHVPNWASKPAPNGQFYAPQYASDTEWLSKTLFDVVQKDKGRYELNKRSKYCESTQPSWPHGQWLDLPFQQKKNNNNTGPVLESVTSDDLSF